MFYASKLAATLMLFSAGALDDLPHLLHVLADARDRVASCEGECCESQSEYFFHGFPFY
jgi:hypothetical protein